MEISIRMKAQPKIGDVAIKKSKRNGTFGLSYCILPFSSLKIFNSFMVVPVIRHIKAWLSSCITAPGKRKNLKAFTFIYFAHSFSMPKLVNTITIKPKAKAKYTVSGLPVFLGYSLSSTKKKCNHFSGFYVFMQFRLTGYQVIKLLIRCQLYNIHYYYLNHRGHFIAPFHLFKRTGRI